MKHYWQLTAFATISIVAGCAANTAAPNYALPTRNEANSATLNYALPARTLADPSWRPADIAGDHGRYPSNYEAIIKSWYAQNLKDPDSVKFGRISKPRKEVVVVDQLANKALYGYSVCASANAKNSYGGFTGQKPHWFFIRDGLVVREQDPVRLPEIFIGHKVNCDDGIG